MCVLISGIYILQKAEYPRCRISNIPKDNGDKVGSRPNKKPHNPLARVRGTMDHTQNETGL